MSLLPAFDRCNTFQTVCEASGLGLPTEQADVTESKVRQLEVTASVNEEVIRF